MSVRLTPLHFRHSRRSRLLAAALVCAAAAIAAAGCGSGTPAQAGKNSTTINIGAATGPMPDDFNPYGSTAASFTASGFIYEPLLQYDIVKPATTYPWLATSSSWSNGDKTLTFQIRQGVKWSDGKPFTASDVAFTFNLLKKYPGLNLRGITFADVTAPSAAKVVMTFQSSGYSEMYAIASTYIVPEHVWASVKNPLTYSDSKPVGTGPFTTVASFSPQGYTLQRNPHYWQAGVPSFNAVHYTSYDSNQSALLDLNQGKLDWTAIFAPGAGQFQSKNPATNHVWDPAFETVYLLLNNQTYPFNQPAVRKAVSLAINRKQITTGGEFGLAFPATNPTGLVLPNDQQWLAPQYAGLAYQGDAKQAEAVLEAAGFTKGANGLMRDKNGKPLSLTLTGTAAFSDFATDGQIIADQLKQIGITVTLQNVAPPEYNSRCGTGQFQAAICNTTQFDPTPGGSYNALLNSTLTAPVGAYARGDAERWIDPATDALLAAYNNATSDAARRQALYGLEKVMVDQAPAVPIFYEGALSQTSTAKVTGWPSASDPYKAGIFVFGPWASVIVSHLKLTK